MSRHRNFGLQSARQHPPLFGVADLPRPIKPGSFIYLENELPQQSGCPCEECQDYRRDNRQEYLGGHQAYSRIAFHSSPLQLAIDAICFVWWASLIAIFAFCLASPVLIASLLIYFG